MHQRPFGPMCHISSMKEERERERRRACDSAARPQPRRLACFVFLFLAGVAPRVARPRDAASTLCSQLRHRCLLVTVVPGFCPRPPHCIRPTLAYGQHLHTASDIAICTSSSAVCPALSASNKLSALLSSLTTAPSGPSTPSPFQSAAAVVLDPATPFAHPGLMSPRLRDKWVVCRPSCTPSKLLCCSRQKPERRSAPPLASQAAAAH